jgi:hypothetical protein
MNLKHIIIIHMNILLQKNLMFKTLMISNNVYITLKFIFHKLVFFNKSIQLNVSYTLK